MGEIRKQRGAKSKAKIALEAVKSEETMSEIGRRHGVHPIQVGKWRKQLIERAEELFNDKRKRSGQEPDERVKELYEQIGRLKVENDFLKKKSVFD
jgi:transposase-like protein